MFGFSSGKYADEACCILQISSINDMYKRLQDYNASLQQYNSKLQSDLSTASESLKKSENDKATFFEELCTLRGHHNSLKEQYASVKVRIYFTMNLISFSSCKLLLF